MTMFEKSHSQVLAWFAAKDKRGPRDLRLRTGETIEGDELNSVFLSAMRARLRSAEKHQPDPLSLPTKKQEGVLWAVLYTIGHMRRKAWKRELHADPNPMTTDEFARELA